MKEIKFKGKDIVGNWYEGNLAIIKHDIYNGAGTIKAGSYISNASGSPFAYQVRPETVGQFTGLYDCTTWEELDEQERKHWVMEGNMPSEWIGKKIYEDDIVEFINIDRQYVKGIVYYFGSCFLIQSIVADEDDYNLGGAFSIAKGLIKVIGTIHDNPELQEVGE